MNNQTNVIKAAKQQSVLESEIESLKSEVIRINSITESISCHLRSPQSSCEGTCDKPFTKTVAGELNSILAIAEGARSQLESIGQLLEEQLGGLKLEY